MSIRDRRAFAGELTRTRARPPEGFGGRRTGFLARLENDTKAKVASQPHSQVPGTARVVSAGCGNLPMCANTRKKRGAMLAWLAGVRDLCQIFQIQKRNFQRNRTFFRGRMSRIWGWDEMPVQ